MRKTPETVERTPYAVSYSEEQHDRRGEEIRFTKPRAFGVKRGGEAIVRLTEDEAAMVKETGAKVHKVSKATEREAVEATAAPPTQIVKKK